MLTVKGITSSTDSAHFKGLSELYFKINGDKKARSRRQSRPGCKVLLLWPRTEEEDNDRTLGRRPDDTSTVATKEFVESWAELSYPGESTRFVLPAEHLECSSSTVKSGSLTASSGLNAAALVHR